MKEFIISSTRYDMSKRKSEGKIKRKGRSSHGKDREEGNPIKEKLSRLSCSSFDGFAYHSCQKMPVFLSPTIPVRALG